MQFDAELYHANDVKLQKTDRKKLARVENLLSEMGFTSEKSEVLMDVGCGPGNVTKNNILPRFPNLKKMIAMDITPNMIEEAKIHHLHPKIEYVVANIEDRSTVEKWMGEITKLTAMYSFNFVKNQKTGFKNVYDLLKPGGEAIFIFPLNGCMYDSNIGIAEDPKYSSYLKKVDYFIPDSYYYNYDAEHYRKLLEDIGFNVIHCKKIEEASGSQDLKKLSDMVYSMCPFTKYIPENLRAEFKEDFSQYVVQSMKRNGGVINMMEILIQKE